MKNKLKTDSLKKKMLLIIILLLTILCISTSVKALTISQSGGVFTYLHHGEDIAENYYVTAIKKDSNGRYAYCLEHDKQLPQGEEFTEGEMDKGLTYILLNGFPNKSFTGNEQKDYYITQASIHLYRGEIQWLYGSDVKDPYGLLPYIKNLVNGAKSYNPVIPSINISKDVQIINKGTYYETNTFLVTKVGNMQYYEILNVPNGIEVVDKTDSGFKLKIAKSFLEGKSEIQVNNIRVRGYFQEPNAKEYTSNNIEIQKLTILNDKIETTSKDSVSFKLKAPVGYIEIYKKDADYSNINLSGVKYEIRDNNNNLVETVTTNTNGYVKSKALPTGKTYTVKEISTRADYVLDSTPVSGIKLNENEIKTLNLTNKKKQGNIKINKVDKDNHKITLGNVDFNLYSEEFQKVIGTYTTNVNGEIKINNLRVGKYKLIEKNTGKWYNLAEDTEVTVEWNKNIEITIENELKKGQVKIIKIDKDNNTVRIPNVTFEILDKNNNVLEKIKTDEYGEATTRKYAIRDYQELKVHEVETNRWYVLNDEIKTIKLEENQIKDIIFDNELKKGQLKITKVDEYNNKVGIKGVKFDLYEDTDLDGKITKKDRYLETMETNIDGVAISKEYRIDRKYLVMETYVPDTYILNPVEIKFELKWNETVEKIVENCPKTIQVKIIKKIKETETPIKDISFDIYKDTNKNGIIDDRDILIDTITTDKDGKAITKSKDFEDKSKVLRVGEQYIVKENTKGIEMLEDKIEILDFNQYIKDYKENQVIDLTILNDLKFIPHKTDKDTGISLEGAEYDIYEDTNANGKFDKEDKIIRHFTTGKDGTAKVAPIPYGLYFAVETKAPIGYVLDTNPIKFYINKEGTTELTLVDKIIENKVKIIKTAKNDSTILGIKKGEGVPNTTFRIYIRNINGTQGDFYKEVTTGEDGTITVTLPYGKYIIKEVKPHDLFLNDSDDQFLDVTDDGVKVDLGFSDTAVNLELDISKTGIIQAQPNDEIRYDFPTLENKSNVSLDDFTWVDHLPYDYVKITKLFTGTYNEDLNYKVFYKTNKNDWTQFGDTYNTLINNCIDFATLNLNNKTEYITDFKIVFGTVKSGFKAVETPFIFTIVDEDVKSTDKWFNRTKLTGNYTDENGNKTELEDNDNWETISYGKKLNITTLPRTGTEGNIELKIVLLTVSVLEIIIVLSEMSKKKEE